MTTQKEIYDTNKRALYLAKTTPSSLWKAAGHPDPHAGMYNCERHELTRGDLTDDELANKVYLTPDIISLTAAKERIRWLSRKYEETQAELTQARAEIERLKVLLTTAKNDLIACYEEQDALRDYDWE